MQTKRRNEGVLLVDNSFAVRNCPNPYPSPTDLERVRRHGLEFPGMCAPAYESATVTCTHCNAVVVLNPQRTREREYCAACDAYLCDGCGLQRKLGRPHVSLAQRFDQIVKNAERQIARGR